MDKRLRMTYIQSHPEEKERFHMCQKRLGANIKEGPSRHRPMTTAREAVILGDHHIKVILGCLGTGQPSLEIKIWYHQGEKRMGAKTPP
ncbi:hypothetical protein SO802_017606 [Lithocarpus litseifolius]|uniref:Uncharacterized protein n=1 Tax=Lithocarpus litseifolius TaxID=425828 RepID=A0AAW2CIW2_9ROSI